MELAIDTASSTVSLALSRAGELLTCLSWQTTHNHTVELLPALVYLLDRVKAGPSSLKAIFVAKGPGSFNGLRVGISIAKGLALALGIPLLGISTLEIQAYLFAPTRMSVRPIQRSGRDQIATALYKLRGDRWECLEAPNVTTVKTMCSQVTERTLFCGEVTDNIAAELHQNLGRRAIISQTRIPCGASVLAMLGWQKLNRGEQDDSAALQPLYLRAPHITSPCHRTPILRWRAYQEMQRDGNR